MGTSIEALIREEKKGYAPFHPLANLYSDELDQETRRRIPVRFNEAVDIIIERAKALIQDIERYAKMPIAKFTIGKSYARQINNRKFDPDNFNTWIKEGIKNRWIQKYEKEGYNGLVVLCGITRDTIPTSPKKGGKKHPLLDQQQYALALEQQLIHFFLFEEQDCRLGNESLDKGALAHNPYAGVVYLAFKLFNIREVWQLFQDTYEFEEEQHEAVFVITDDRPVRDQNVGEKKILGGRKAEDHVRAYLHRARYPNGIKIFATHMPSMQFVNQLLHYRQGLETFVVVARDLINVKETDKQALDKLSYNGCIVREFGEKDWNHLAKTLLYSEEGISHKKAAELEDFNTYIRKTKEEIMEMFHESMVETEKQKREKTEHNDALFIIRAAGYHQKIICGKTVEQRVMHILKDQSQGFGFETNVTVYVNYKPSERFVEFLKETMKNQEHGVWKSVSVLVGSEDEIKEQFQIKCNNERSSGSTVREIKISTMTGNELDTLRCILPL